MVSWERRLRKIRLTSPRSFSPKCNSGRGWAVTRAVECQASRSVVTARGRGGCRHRGAATAEIPLVLRAAGGGPRRLVADVDSARSVEVTHCEGGAHAARMVARG